MNFRVLGKTGLKVSALGFGCMRLPASARGINGELAIPLLRRAVELGVNYFDTAVRYGDGDSERVLGDALHDMRGEVILSTKNHIADPEKADVWQKNFEDSLRKLRTGHIDIYNIHGLSWEKFQAGFRGKGSLMDLLIRAKEQGMVRHLCFSCHDTPENIVKLAGLGIFESVTLQYNLLDRANEPVIDYLKEMGLGVVVMGPVAGGRLANQTVEGGAGGAASAELALKFVLSNPHVDITLSGMSDLEMLERNVAIANADLSLSQEESAEVARAGAAQANLLGLYCTACGYCMPCPSGVDIPRNFTLAQVDQAYGMAELAKERYGQLQGRARFCLDCGTCLDECPQKLDIPKHMKRIAERLDPDFGNPVIEGRLSEIRQAEGGLEIALDITPLNLGATPVQGDLTVDVAGDEVFRKTLKLMGGKGKKLPVKACIAPSENRDDFPILATLEGEGFRCSWSSKCRALFAPRIEPGQPVKPDRIFLDRPDQLVIGDEALRKKHGLRFRAAHDGEWLIVSADADEDFCGTSSGAEGPGKDCLHMFLDCRSPDKICQGRYEPGCAHLHLVPGLDGREARIDMFTVVGLDLSGARIESAIRENGYRIEARFPLSALNLPEGQRVFGFDLGQASVDSSGQFDCALLWAGHIGAHHSTSGFGRLWLG